MKHEIYTRSDGTALEFIRVTDEPCPACNPYHQAKLGIVHEDNNSQQIHCTRCDYAQARPYKHPAGRLMNGG